MLNNNFNNLQCILNGVLCTGFFGLDEIILSTTWSLSNTTPRYMLTLYTIGATQMRATLTVV